jgi:hypothetical protein
LWIVAVDGDLDLTAQADGSSDPSDEEVIAVGRIRRQAAPY